ncbi:MAG: prepilin-type cleavage/methylation domain-containing protein [Verrucomicrobiota bacterium]|jgi:competence protein ComGC
MSRLTALAGTVLDFRRLFPNLRRLGLTLNWRAAAVSKLDMARKTSKMGGFTATEICIVVGLIVLLAAVVIPRFVRKPPMPPAHMACISNLRFIDSAKGQWALENQKKKTDTPADSDLQPYMGRGSAGELPVCPVDPNQTFDTSYSINNVGTKPTCKILPAKHILP